MDVNGVVQREATPPNATAPAQGPAPIPRASTERSEDAPTARESTPRSDEVRTPSAPDILAARTAAKTRGGTRVRVDRETDQIITQIVNKNNEVIRQLPPEEVLKASARFQRLVGVIFDQSA